MTQRFSHYSVYNNGVSNVTVRSSRIITIKCFALNKNQDFRNIQDFFRSFNFFYFEPISKGTKGEDFYYNPIYIVPVSTHLPKTPKNNESVSTIF